MASIKGCFPVLAAGIFCLACSAAAAPKAKGASAAKTTPAPAPSAAPAKPTKPATPAEPGFRDRLQFDAFLSGGISTPVVYESWWEPASRYQSSPQLLQWGLGVGVAYKIDLQELLGEELMVLPGFTTDFRFIGQYTEVDARIGNFRGTRLVLLSPALGIRWTEDFLAKVGFQFLGNYSLSLKTEEGQSYSYAKPLGFRVTALYRVGRFVGRKNLFAGLHYESVSFSERRISGVTESPIAPKLGLWQLGVTIDHLF